ncbi:hypothetical protein JB92DRAFT_2866093 [Gautieria morchelliformis]|nr:hypothetical protein JB92DRAFT_2866093 [Gautieria morchelliformis]
MLRSDGGGLKMCNLVVGVLQSCLRHCEIVSAAHSIRLRLALNFSVFSIEILNNPPRYFRLLASRRTGFGQQRI